MIGQRLPNGTDWHTGVAAGSYWKGDDGRWYAITPNGLFAGLANHGVVEHDDGTITVSPSILCRQPNVGEYHGYLERGAWRSC